MYPFCFPTIYCNQQSQKAIYIKMIEKAFKNKFERSPHYKSTLYIFAVL